MNYQPIDNGQRVKQRQQLNSQLLLINFYFVLHQFRMNRARFSFVLPTYVQFCTQIVVLSFRAYSAANYFRSPQKVGPHAHQQPVQRFQICHQ